MNLGGNEAQVNFQILGVSPEPAKKESDILSY